MLTKKRKVELVKKFGKNTADTGSTEVQVALLTERINSLTDHLRKQPKDFSSRRGLLKLVGQRRNFMNYLKKRNSESHNTVSKQLNIRIKWATSSITEDVTKRNCLLKSLHYSGDAPICLFNPFSFLKKILHLLFELYSFRYLQANRLFLGKLFWISSLLLFNRNKNSQI